LAERAGQVFTDDTGDNVARPARSERHDHGDRPRRIVFRPGKPADSRKDGNDYCEMQKWPAEKSRGVSPNDRGFFRREAPEPSNVTSSGE
jgi:hypothetical protein